MKNQDKLNGNNLEEDIIKCLNDILTGFTEITKCINQKNEQTSHLFNPLRFFDIGETKNSFLLAKLLDPNGEHGQGGLFLTSFLNHIGINSGGKWIVVAEKGRIDISIKRRHPHSVIVIENKSHGARDGKSQLYRYWYKQILEPFKKINGLNENKRYGDTLGISNSSYRLIYLTRGDKEIEPCSLENDIKITGDDLPLSLEKAHIMFLTFEGYIVEWLTDCIKKLDPSNYRLRVFLEEYIELWKI